MTNELVQHITVEESTSIQCLRRSQHLRWASSCRQADKIMKAVPLFKRGASSQTVSIDSFYVFAAKQGPVVHAMLA